MAQRLTPSRILDAPERLESRRLLFSPVFPIMYPVRLHTLLRTSLNTNVSVPRHQEIQITPPPPPAPPWSLANVTRLLALRFFAGRGLTQISLVPGADPITTASAMSIATTRIQQGEEG